MNPDNWKEEIFVGGRWVKSPGGPNKKKGQLVRLREGNRLFMYGHFHRKMYVRKLGDWKKWTCEIWDDHARKYNTRDAYSEKPDFIIDRESEIGYIESVWRITVTYDELDFLNRICVQ